MNAVFRPGHDASSLAREAHALARAFDETGVLVFPGLMRDDARFTAFCADVRRLLSILGARAGVAFAPDESLDAMVTRLAVVDRPALGRLYDLGTQPNKLFSGAVLKTHPALLAFAHACFGDDALLATPAMSDTLHVFPPGEENFRFNLPLHHDYPYLLQSPRQFTVWVNLGEQHAGVGGVTVYPGSHRDEARATVDVDGHVESVVGDGALDAYEAVSIEAGFGDVVVMSTHLLHTSDRNRTRANSRIVQLFRYSDLTDERSIASGWASAERRTRTHAQPEVARAS